nr:MAG TPA: hypothetical protein [Caudoviricetes sp.]
MSIGLLNIFYIYRKEKICFTTKSNRFVKKRA